MTFKRITFLFIALLLSMLLMLQYWLIQTYTKDVSSKIGEAAFQVSRSTIKSLVFQQPQTELKGLAITGKITNTTEIEILNSFNSIPKDVNISLKDGQTDQFISMTSAGFNSQIDIPRTGIEKSLDGMSNKILLSAIVFIFLGLVAAGFFARSLASPLRKLQRASEHIGKGHFGFQIEGGHHLKSIELTETINAFNEMSNKIEKLQNENDKLQKKTQLAELSEITRSLAHTIRNPLNTLSLAVDQLTGDNPSESNQELAKISKHQIKRIDKWVRSFMDIMSSDSNLIEVIDISQMITECIDEVALEKSGLKNPNLTGKNISLEIEQSDGVNSNFQLTGVRPELKSILQSLISNAIESTKVTPNNSLQKDSPQKQEDNSVNIKLKKQKNLMQITILDKGCGFDKKILSKLFSPHNTNKTYGAGMGLYLAQRIISLKYEGEITVANNPIQLKKGLTGSKIILTLQNRV